VNVLAIDTMRSDRWGAYAAVIAALAVLGWVIYGIVVRHQGGGAVQGPSTVAQRPGPRTGSDINMIINAHLLGQSAAPATAAAPPPKTRLRLTLVGSVASPDASRALAVIAADAGPAKPYRIGETVSTTGAVVREVKPDRVILDRSGKLESLQIERPTLDNPGAGPAVPTADVRTVPSPVAPPRPAPPAAVPAPPSQTQ